jgi:hypothetical protein
MRYGFRRSLGILTAVGALSLGVAGCEPADGTEEGDVTAMELSAKADGITIWLDPVAHPTARFGQPAWRFDGHVSKNLESVFAFSSDDEFGEAIQTSARKFEVFVDGIQLERLLTGYRLLLDVKTTTGTVRRYSASIRVAPKLERAHGSSKITLRKTFSPFFFGKELRFRNLVSVASGYAAPSALTDRGSSPEIFAPSGASFAMDWIAPALADLSSDPAFELDVSTSNGGAPVARSGGVDVGVTSLQITTKAAFDQWPEPTCADATLHCLEGLPGAVDRSTCGAAIDVAPCLWKLPPAADETTFSTDLSLHLVNWYGEHGADVLASGANTVGQARALSGASKVTVVTDPEEDPHAHDLTKFIVFRHPDVVFPGSDTAWFGAYDRATGALESIYDFN